jgi:glycosyltransferase involved in cell wall biosynthesis
MAKDTIAFVSTYEHPSRDSVERVLRSEFPQFRFEVIDVGDIIRAHKSAWRLPNLLCTFREYGGNVLLRRSSLREQYFRTTYLMRKLRQEMRSYIDPARHIFSFQMQSVFDTAVPGVPHFIYTDHTHLSNLHSPYFDRRLLRPKAWRALEREIYHNAMRVFTRSTDVTADLVKDYGVPPENAVCVYAGSNVDVSQNFRPQNGDYSNKHILFVGEDWERKGGPELASAFRRVLEVHPTAHLTVVGPKFETNLPNCTVLGKVPLEQLTDVYAQASVFCLPTRLEPFGIAFLEAMMHQLPIVATRTGAVPDMVQEGTTGMLVTPGDSDGLAAALISLLGDAKTCRRFGIAGRQRALDLYTWEHVGERMRTHIVSAIAPKYASSLGELGQNLPGQAAPVVARHQQIAGSPAHLRGLRRPV